MCSSDCIEFAEIKGKTEGRAEGRTEGLAEGKAKGLAEGRAEVKTAIAKSLKDSGMDLQDISKHTGLTVAEIEAL